jgi:3-oxoadipate enol-lactonase
MAAPATHRLAVGDARLAVHTAGSGLPTVLLHGFPLDHSMWAGQEPLAEHLRLVVPDCRGFGGSDGPGPRSIAELADDVVALLDALHVAGPAVVCGLSMGGYVAQHVAARHPDRVAALVLVDTKLEADTPESRAGRADLAAKAGRLGPGIVAEAMVPRLLGPRPVDAAAALRHDEIAALLRRTIGAQRVPTIQAALAALADRPDMTGPMARCMAPTLLVVGAEDAITPPACLEAAAAIMPRARLLIVPGAGHMTPLEAPETFNQALLGFLREAMRPA